MRKITFVILMSLLSWVGYSQFPEGFEDPWSPSGPDVGWGIYQNLPIGPGQQWRQTVGFPDNPVEPVHSGSFAAYIGRENVPNTTPPSPAQDWLVTPAFTLPANAQLRFWSALVAPGNQGGVFKVKIIPATGPNSDASVLSNYTDVMTWTEPTLNPAGNLIYEEKLVSIPATAGQVRLAFFMEGDFADSWLIDDVNVVSECLMPTALTASNVGTTSATYQWTGTAPSYDVEVVLNANAPTGVPTDSNIVGTTYNDTTGLLPDTAYKYYVRAVCGPGNPSPWAGPFAFTTVGIGDNCAAPIVIGGLPFSATDNTSNYGDNFDGTPGATGCGTTAAYLNGDEVVYSYTAATTGAISVSMTNNGANSGMFIYDDCADIGVNCVGGGIGNATTPVNIPTLSVIAGTTYYIVISSSTTQSTPYTLTVQTVTCPPPTNLSATGVDADSANLSWNANGATSWEIIVQNQGAGIPAGAGVTVTDNSDFNVTATIPGAVNFNPSTAYEYYVRADCGAGDGTFSQWAGPFVFTTTQIPAALPFSDGFEGPISWTLSNATQTNKWTVGTAVANGGTHSLYITDDNGVSNSFTNTAGTVVHAYRDIQMPALADQMNLSFDWRALAESCCDYLKVWVAPGTFNPTPGTMIAAVPGSIVQIGGNMNGNANFTTVNAVVNGQPYQGGVLRLIFEWRNDPSIGNDPPAAVDNVNLSLITCPAPTNLAVANLEIDEATLTWTGPGSVTPTFDGYLSTSITPPTGTTTPTQDNIPAATVTLPLDPSTTYYFWVRSDCGSGDVSTWTGPVTFNTPQIPATTDFVDGFEAPSTSWTLNNGTQTNKWIVGSAVASSGTQSLYITNDNGVSNSFTNTANTVVHAYRDITIPDNVDQLLLSYDWRAVAEACCDYLKVWIVPVGFTPTPGTMIGNGGGNTQYGGNMNSNANWTTVNQIIPAAAYENTTIRLVFEWRNDGSIGNNPPAAVDNVNLSVITCPSPTALVLNSVDQDSAVISWTAPATAPDGYDYYVSTTNTTPAEDVVVSGSVDSPATTATLEPLTPSTTYYVWVRSDCGDDDVSFWVGPLQFNTTQIPADLNYADDFEGTVNWSFVNGTGINKWVVGTAVNNGGTHSLYVTNDNGVSNAYTDNSFTVLHAYRDIQIPDDVPGNIFISFDWRNQAESCCDFLNVWLVPTTFTPVAGTQITPGPDRFQILNNENGQLAFINNMYTFAGSAYEGQTMRLVFQWKHDGSVNVQPPAAIDNINIIVETCPAPIDLISNSIPGATEVELTWTPVGTETQWELVIQPFNGGNPGNAPADSIILDEPTYTFEPVEGEFYEYYVRPICGPDDVGLWAGPLPFSIFNPPGCANVEVMDPDLEIIAPGGDIVICPDEPDDCVDLTAGYMATGTTDQYTVEAIDYDPPFPFSGGTAISVGTDDVWSPVVNLPFNFCFFGEIYSNCLVGSNGVITFNNGIPNHTAGGFCPWQLTAPIPNTGTQIKNAIYGVLQDIDPNIDNEFANPDINYQVLGNYPCRALVVNFSEVAQFGGLCNNNPAIGPQTTQIVLYEISNVIEIYVGRRVPCTDWQAGAGVIGLQNAAGTVAYTPANRNTGAWTAIEEAYRFTPAGTPNVVFEWLEQVGPNPEDVVVLTNDVDINVCITDDPRTFIARATYTTCTDEELIRESQVTVRKAEVIDEDAINLVECPNEDGSATFNLPESMVDIIAGLSDPADFTFSYYLSQAAAEAGGTDNLPEVYTTSTLPSTIYVRIVDTQANCPAIIKSFTISISTDIPDYELEGDLAICDNETTVISVEPAIPGATYEWTQDGDPLPDTGSSITVSEPGVYGVTVTTGCAVTKTVTVTESPAPVVDDLADVTECDEFILPALVNPGNTYHTAPAGGGEQLFAGEPITSSQTIYIFAQLGTCTAESDFEVTINPTPEFNLGGPYVVCDAESVVIQVNAENFDPATATYAWTYEGAPVGGNTSSLAGVGYGNYEVTVTIGDCSDTSSVAITQDTTPLAFNLGGPYVVCDPELAIISVNAENFDPAVATYAWTFDGNPVGGNTSSLQGIDFGTYQVTVSIGDCTGTQSIAITEDTDAFALALSHGCEDNTYMIHLDPVEDAEGNLSFNPDTATISWTGPNGFTSSDADAEVDTEGVYTVTVTTPEGCISQGALEVLSTTCLIPRGISPNNDTMNDNFDLTGFNVTKLSIFNRYGREVYSFGGAYTNQWYGQTDGGDELPTGTYFYSMQRSNGETRTGWVYINRQEN